MLPGIVTVLAEQALRIGVQRALGLVFDAFQPEGRIALKAFMADVAHHLASDERWRAVELPPGAPGRMASWSEPVPPEKAS